MGDDRAIYGVMNSIDVMRHARLRAKLSVKEMATALGVTAQFVYDIEHGRRGIPEQMVERFPGESREIVAEAFVQMHEERVRVLRALIGGSK